jgi:hypothetical protein
MAGNMIQPYRGILPNGHQKRSGNIVNAPAPGTDLTTWTGQLLKNAGHDPDMLIHQPNRSLYQIHHKFNDREIFFITNTNRRSAVKSELSMDLQGKSLWNWNPENGQCHPDGI